MAEAGAFQALEKESYEFSVIISCWDLVHCTPSMIAFSWSQLIPTFNVYILTPHHHFFSFHLEINLSSFLLRWEIKKKQNGTLFSILFWCSNTHCKLAQLSHWVAKCTLHVFKYWKFSDLDGNIAADKWPNVAGQWPAPALLDGVLPTSSKSKLCWLRSFPGISFLWQPYCLSQNSELNQTAPALVSFLEQDVSAFCNSH